VIEPIQADRNKGMKDGEKITFPPVCFVEFRVSWEIFLFAFASGQMETSGNIWTERIELAV
jgi:hypothetical protein